VQASVAIRAIAVGLTQVAATVDLAMQLEVETGA